METTEELTAFLLDITQDGYRGRLQARGQARALIRHEGNLPPDAPAFSEGIDSDLADYGFSVLRASLALRELGGDAVIWRKGFVQAGGAFEALVQNGSQADASRGFYRTVGLLPITWPTTLRWHFRFCRNYRPIRIVRLPRMLSRS